MNWLAHLFLSDPEPACRIGNLLPDFLSANVLAGLPAAFQRGIAQHRRIDAYTDAHPVFRRSVQRFAPPFRRYGGVLVDIFYDHFLARDWTPSRLPRCPPLRPKFTLPSTPSAPTFPPPQSPRCSTCAAPTGCAPTAKYPGSPALCAAPSTSPPSSKATPTSKPTSANSSRSSALT
jgi:hypothetical protein